MKRHLAVLSVLCLLIPTTLFGQQDPYANVDPPGFWGDYPTYIFPPWQPRIPPPKRDLYNLIGYYSLMYNNSGAVPSTAQVLTNITAENKLLASQLEPLLSKTAETMTAEDITAYNNVVTEMYGFYTSNASSGYYGGLWLMTQNAALINLPSRINDYVTIPAAGNDPASVAYVVKTAAGYGLTLTDAQVSSLMQDASIGTKSATASWGLTQLSLGNLPAAYINAGSTTQPKCPTTCALLKITPAATLILTSSAMIVAATGHVEVAVVLAGTAGVSVAVMLVSKIVQANYNCAPCK